MHENLQGDRVQEQEGQKKNNVIWKIKKGDISHPQWISRPLSWRMTARGGDYAAIISLTAWFVKTYRPPPNPAPVHTHTHTYAHATQTYAGQHGHLCNLLPKHALALSAVNFCAVSASHQLRDIALLLIELAFDIYFLLSVCVNKKCISSAAPDWMTTIQKADKGG